MDFQLNGVRIDGLTLDEAVERAMQKREAACTVVTPNAVMLDACRHDARYATLLNSATLALPDGRGILMAAKRQGTTLPMRVAGIDFGEQILQKAALDGSRVFLLGGKDGVAARAAEKLTAQMPNLQICGTHHGYFDRLGTQNDRVCAKIRADDPQILFVCLGFPIQEEWMMQNLQKLPSVRLCACLGGSLDVWSGKIKRAPLPVQKVGLEWAWRMLRQPRRLKQLPAVMRCLLGKTV